MASREATGQLRLTVFLTGLESRTTVKPQTVTEQGDFLRDSEEKSQDGKCRLSQAE